MTGLAKSVITSLTSFDYDIFERNAETVMKNQVGSCDNNNLMLEHNQDSPFPRPLMKNNFIYAWKGVEKTLDLGKACLVFKE